MKKTGQVTQAVAKEKDQLKRNLNPNATLPASAVRVPLLGNVGLLIETTIKVRNLQDPQEAEVKLLLRYHSAAMQSSFKNKSEGTREAIKSVKCPLHKQEAPSSNLWHSIPALGSGERRVLELTGGTSSQLVSCRLRGKSCLKNKMEKQPKKDT